MTRESKRASLHIGKQIKAQFCDGKWHSVETIAAATGARVENVWTVLNGMRLHGYHKTKADRKKVGAEYHFRLSPKEKQISVHELIERPHPSSRSWKFKVEQTQRRCHRRLCAL